MIFITVWTWSFAIAMLLIMIACYRNPGKMYLDVFILIVIVAAIPGMAIVTIIDSIYKRLFVLTTKEAREASAKTTWEQVEDLHNTLQMFRGKF